MYLDYQLIHVLELDSICAHVHTYINTYLYPSIHSHMHTHTRACMYTHIQSNKDIYSHLHGVDIAETRSYNLNICVHKTQELFSEQFQHFRK